MRDLRYVGCSGVVGAFIFLLAHAPCFSVAFLLAVALVIDIILAIRGEETITQMVRAKIDKPYNLGLLLGLLGITWWITGPVIALPMIVGAVLGHILGDF